MYIVLNKGLGMSTGKAAAQASHAAVEAYRISCRHGEEGFGHLIETGLVNQWYKGGHYMKLVMEARDREHLLDIERYLNGRGFKTALILDEGHTEVASIVPTALGIEIVDKDSPHVAATFSSLDLYRDRPTIIETDHLTPEELSQIKHWLQRGWSADLINEWLRTRRAEKRSTRTLLGRLRRS
jgi:peptidyl-tRNA hydrolase